MVLDLFRHLLTTYFVPGSGSDSGNIQMNKGTVPGLKELIVKQRERKTVYKLTTQFSKCHMQKPCGRLSEPGQG